MSIKVMTAVFETTLPPSEKIVALKLADHAHDDGTSVYPSAASLATYCSMSERQVWRIIKILLDKGVIILEKSGGGRKSNLYHFSLDSHGAISTRSTDNLAYLDCSSTDTDVIAPMTPEDRSTDTDVIGINRTVIESSPEGYPPSFEALWKIYPKKKGKLPAFKKYKVRLKEGADPERLHMAVVNYAEEKRGTEERFILNGETFFGPGERWCDYLPATIDPATLEQAKAWDEWDSQDFNSVTYPEPSFPRPQNSEGNLLDGEGRAYYRDPMQPTKRRYFDDE